MGIDMQEFMVDDNPHAIQGVGLKEYEKQYVKDLNPDIWRYHLDHLPNQIEDFSYLDALEIRRIVSQNIETVFALLFAILQSSHFAVSYTHLTLPTKA